MAADLGPVCSVAAIKNYQIGRRIPHCGFELELLSEQVQRLRHKVVIKGVPSPNSFHIRYPQPEAGIINHRLVYTEQWSLHTCSATSVSTAVSPLVQQPSAAVTTDWAPAAITTSTTDWSKYL